MLRNHLPLVTAAASLALAVAFHASRPNPVAPAESARAGSLTLNARLSHKALATDTQDVWAQIDLQGTVVQRQTPARPPMELVVVLDQSGSMMGQKIYAAKQAVHSLTALMEPNDRVALVAFSDYASLRAPLTLLGDGRDTIASKVDEIEAHGGTNIGDAHQAGLGAFVGARPGASKVMFLISDGQATHGVTTTPELEQLAASGLQEHGVAVTTIGIGDGFNETLLGGMATAGGGKFYYSETAEALAEQLQIEWRGLAAAVARNVRVTLKPKPGVKIKRVHGFSTQWKDGEASVYIDSIFSGATRKLMVELQAGERPGNAENLLSVELGYDDLTDDGTRRTDQRHLGAATSTKPLLPNDVNIDVLGRGQLVQTAQTVSGADELWASNNRKQARELLDAQFKRNLAFINQWGPAEDVVAAQEKLKGATWELQEVIQEKRQIRIRKKRKQDTIEIISGN